MTDSTELLSDILSELKKANRHARLWDAGDVADYFGLSRSSAYSRIVCRPDFPRAIQIEGVGRRWKPAEVQAYADRKRASA
jgi:predicted DNA-binding transcriptional regulator AlpA